MPPWVLYWPDSEQCFTDTTVKQLSYVKMSEQNKWKGGGSGLLGGCSALLLELLNVGNSSQNGA